MSQSQSAENGDRVAERGFRGGGPAARAFPEKPGKAMRLRERTGDAPAIVKSGEP